MQHAVYNSATIRVADRTGVRGRVTADEVNLDRFHNRIRKVCALVVATLILPALAYSQGANPIAALQAQVTALQTAVGRLQTNNSALQSQVNTLQSQLATVQSNPALALGPFVSVDPNPENGVTGPNIKFTGANIHILSGSGATNDNVSHGGTVTGLGNLIIGYDEFSGTIPAGARGGSHNLVIGSQNSFTSSAFGGLVAGDSNTISAEGASVSGGAANTASDTDASVSGGVFNTASGAWASVTGGRFNTASNFYASVSGGVQNTASGPGASVGGGGANTADVPNSVVLGGEKNAASGVFSVVLGGFGIINSTDNSIRPQPPFSP